MAGLNGSRLDTIPAPAELKRQAEEREAALPKVEEKEVGTEISVQDRGDAIVSRASTALSGFLASMQTRMNSFAAKARKALGLGVGAVAAGAEGAVTHGRGLAGGALEAAKGAAVGSIGMARHAAEDFIAAPAAALYDAVRPRKAFDPDAMAAVEMDIIETREAIRNGDAATKNDMIAHLALLEAEKAEIENTQRELRGADTVRAVGGALKKGGEVVAGAAVAGAVGSAMAARAGGKWVAGKAEQGILTVAEKGADIADKVLETAAEKKEKYLEAGRVVSEALSKLSGKEIVLSEKQMLALGAAMDAYGTLESVLKMVGEASYDAMLMGDAVDIVTGLGRGGIMLKNYVTDPNVPKQIWDDLNEFNIVAGAAIGSAASAVTNKLVVNPAMAAGRGIGTAAGAVAGGVAMGVMGGVTLGAAGVGAAVEGGRYAGRKTTEGLDALGNAGVALEAKVRERASAAVNTPEMLLLRKNIAETPGALRGEIEKADKQLVELTARGASFFERMRNKVAEFVSTVREAFNKLREPMITKAMAEDHPDLAEGIPVAIDQLAQITEAAAETKEEAPEKRVATAKRAVRNDK